MYKSLDLTIDKIARRMRKHKTRLLKKHRPKPENTIKHLEEKWYNENALDHPEESAIDPEPLIVHREGYRLRTLFKEEAIMELELSDKPFVLFKNARRNINQLVYRRKDGEYSLLELPTE